MVDRVNATDSDQPLSLATCLTRAAAGEASSRNLAIDGYLSGRAFSIAPAIEA